MKLRTVFRVAIVLLAGLAIVAPANAASAHHPQFLRPFFADRDDTCTYTWTEGRLSWKAWHPPDTPGVNVWGEVGFRQRPSCAYIVPVVPFADFTAYIDDRLVDHEVVRVGERNPTDFRFTLESSTLAGATAEIDRVEVRACLVSSMVRPPIEAWDEIPAAWCGEPDVHRR